MSRTPTLIIATLTLAAASVGFGQTFTVTTNADAGAGTLRQAILDANAFGGAATINLSAGLGTITLGRELPVLLNPAGITINGNGNTIDGGSTSNSTGYRVFFVGVSDDIASVSPGLNATNATPWAISNLNIRNANARGGNGGNGGIGAGGGAGLGGAIFVNAGELTLSGVTFADNRAVGGNGGTQFQGTFGGGGGGGMGGHGGNADNGLRTAGGGGGFGIGAGGAVFVRQGASVVFVDGGLTGGRVQGGAGGGTAGSAGQGIGSGLFLAGSASYSVSAGNTVTLADTLGGGVNSQITGGFAKIGQGTLVLAGTNSFTGGVTLADGTLSVGSDANLGDAGNALIFNGGTLQITGNTFASTPRTIQWTSGGFDIADPLHTFTVDQTLIGGTLTKTGPGTLQLGGSADNVGLGALVNAGTLVLAKASTPDVHAIGGGGLTINNGTARLAGTGNDQVWDGAGVTLNAGTFDLAGLTETINTLNGSGGVLTNSTGNGVLTVSSGDFAGGTSLSGGGSISLIKQGAGTLNLTGVTDNAFLGVTVNGGTIVLAKDSNPGVHALGGGLTINSGGLAQLAGTGGDQIFDGTGVTLNAGTFDLNGRNETIASLNGNGTVTSSAPATLSVGSGDYSGVITDAVGLHKVGTGTRVLSGDSTYTGPTVIAGGTLEASSLRNGGVASSIGASSSSAGSFVLDGGTLRSAGASAVGGTDRLFTVTQNGGTLDASIPTGTMFFTNPGPVAFTGTGPRTLTLTGT